VSLDLEIARRNARFRAWRAYGLAFEGGWELVRVRQHSPGWTSPPNPGAMLDLRCGECGRHHKTLAPSPDITSHPWGRNLDAALAEVLNGLYRAGCSHLSPLLGEDPPEVRAIWEMEILSGG
jgi:hypothetical protein